MDLPTDQSRATANTPFAYGIRSLCSALLIVLSSIGTSVAEPVEIVLPPETASFRSNPGAEYAMGQCLQCHSAEYVSTQPLLNRDGWKASIEKMRKKYGAVIPEKTEETLLDYLVNTYGKPSPNPAGN